MGHTDHSIRAINDLPRTSVPIDEPAVRLPTYLSVIGLVRAWASCVARLLGSTLRLDAIALPFGKTLNQHSCSVGRVAVGDHQAAEWQRLAYVQFAAAVLLGALAVLALTGLVDVPRDGGLGPPLVAFISLGLGMRSLRKAHELS